MSELENARNALRSIGKFCSQCSFGEYRLVGQPDGQMAIEVETICTLGCMRKARDGVCVFYRDRAPTADRR